MLDFASRLLAVAWRDPLLRASFLGLLALALVWLVLLAVRWPGETEAASESEPASDQQQALSVTDSPGTIIVQSRGDVAVQLREQTAQGRVRSFWVELTTVWTVDEARVNFGERRVEAPNEQAFFEGPGGRLRLNVPETVQVVRRGGGHAAIVARFSVAVDDIILLGQPITQLGGYTTLRLPLLHANRPEIYRSVTLAQLLVTVNGIDLWGSSSTTSPLVAAGQPLPARLDFAPLTDLAAAARRQLRR